MALIPCVNCGEQYSDQDPVCPHCGLPRGRAIHRRRQFATFTAVLAVIGVLAITGKLSHAFSQIQDNALSSRVATAGGAQAPGEILQYDRAPGKNVVTTVELRVSASTPDSSQIPALSIRCRGDQTEVLVEFVPSLAPQFGEVDSSTVLVRLNGRTWLPQRWKKSDDRKGLVVPNPISFLRQMTTARWLGLQVTSLHADPVSAGFDLTGVHQQLGEQATSCGLAVRREASAQRS